MHNYVDETNMVLTKKKAVNTPTSSTGGGLLNYNYLLSEDLLNSAVCRI